MQTQQRIIKYLAKSDLFLSLSLFQSALRESVLRGRGEAARQRPGQGEYAHAAQPVTHRLALRL